MSQKLYAYSPKDGIVVAPTAKASEKGGAPSGLSRFAREFKGSGLLFDQAMAQSRMAVCITDPKLPDNPIVFANEAFFELTGYGPEEVLGRNCRFMQGAGTDKNHITYIRDAITKEKTVVVELVNYRRDGTKFWNALHLGPLYGDDGQLLYYFGSQWDVTEVYEARMESQSSRLHAGALKERLRNVFASLGSVLGGKSEREPVEAGVISARIAALGRAYDATLDGAFAGRAPLHDVVHRVMSAYDPTRSGRYAVEGPDISVQSEIVSAIGLCLHELATHAIKHGAWSNSGGQSVGTVSIDWSLENGDIRLLWREHGGPDGAGRAFSGRTASNILITLMKTVDGTMTHTADEKGLLVTLSMPSRSTISTPV